MSQIATHPTFATPDVTADPAPRTARRFGGTWRTYLDAMREGVAAGQRYEALRGRGLSHDQAIARAMSETGFGT